MSFIVYFIICLFDFVIMPTVYESMNKEIEPRSAAEIALQFSDPMVQQEIIRQLTEKRSWQPLTMDGAAAFHFAFGAILGGAAWGRSQENVARIRTRSTRRKNSAVTPDNPDDDYEE
jgi:hypothetical protein